MDRLKSCSTEDKKAVIAELQNIGCCDLCVVRYLGVGISEVYRSKTLTDEIIKQNNGESNGAEITSVDMQTGIKIKKKNPCSTCLGLLEDGVQEDWLHKISDGIKQSEIEAYSFCPAISLPISIQIRAYSTWFHLKNKFPEIFASMEDLKPDGIAIKSVWKWICSDSLRLLVNPDSEWSITGNVTVRINVKYIDEHEECLQLNDYLRNVMKMKKKKGGEIVTRGTVESTFRNMSCADFMKYFKCPPSIPTEVLKFGTCECSHSPIFIAGRYRKYSRDLSQTPWIIDGVRKTESSVEELISGQILPFLQAEESTFLSSGREDVDVRTLGNGRPFAFEVINPKRTLFTQERMLELQEKINSSTEKISVNSIQLIEKKDLFHLKHGEETKTKSYCALCSTFGIPVTSEMMDVLNNQSLPLVLSQRTPIRVLHRRTSSDRPRSILAMKASIVPDFPDTFILHLTTEAGTYVKEFVHGDFGRTFPNISLLLKVETDIFALDVEEVNLDWPPITNDIETEQTMETEEVSCSN